MGTSVCCWIHRPFICLNIQPPDFYNQFKRFLFLIKMFCQKSEAVFGRNDHKRRRRCQKVVFFKAQRSDLNKDFKLRCSKPVCRPTSFPCFATVDSSLILHSKFNIVRKVLTVTNISLFELVNAWVAFPLHLFWDRFCTNRNRHSGSCSLLRREGYYFLSVGW